MNENSDSSVCENVITYSSKVCRRF